MLGALAVERDLDDRGETGAQPLGRQDRDAALDHAGVDQPLARVAGRWPARRAPVRPVPGWTARRRLQLFKDAQIDRIEVGWRLKDSISAAIIEILIYRIACRCNGLFHSYDESRESISRQLVLASSVNHSRGSNHVWHRRRRQHAQHRSDPDRRPEAPRIPRLRLLRRRRAPGRRAAPGAQHVARGRARSPGRGRPASKAGPASPTPAGRRTARRRCTTRIRISRTAAGPNADRRGLGIAAAASRWCTTASSRTTTSCATSCRPRATSSRARPTPRSSPT